MYTKNLKFAVGAALALLASGSAVQNLAADFVIVGGGSGGLTMAHQLATKSSFTVIVLEAGGDPAAVNPTYSIPMLDVTTYGLPESDWLYHLEPQVHASGVNKTTFRFKGLGGCSQHNGEGFWTATKDVQNKWPNGFKFNDFKAAAKEIEGFVDCGSGSCPNHGTTGPLYTRIDTLDTVDPFLIAWKAAALEAGYDFSPDSNAPHVKGYMPNVVSIKNGHRYSVYGMLKDAITAGLPNLQIKLNTTATRILNNGYDSHGNLQVTGVSAVYNDGTSTTDFNYFANKGVILAAGAFNSPQLLMVSGIGDSDHLSSLGIPVKVELKGVGQNLKDHYGLPLIYVLKQFSPINNATFFNEQLAQYASDGTGYFAWPAFNHALITANSNGNVNTKPDVAFATGPWNFNFPDPHQSVVFPILVNPYSTGTVKIRSDSVFDQPIIDPNYFGDSRDYDTLTNAFNVARTILGQSAFSDWFNFEVFPTGVPDAVVKTTVTSTEHYMGTCKMGKHNDEYAVVDNDGSVFGTNNLYIADASAIPVTGGALPDASIHASVILLSKIIADSLLCDFGNVCN